MFLLKTIKAQKAVVEKNILHCGLQDRANIYLSDAVSYASRSATYDIVFLDPPYHKNLVDKVLPLVAANMSDGGIIACETAKDEALPNRVPVFPLPKRKNTEKSSLRFTERTPKNENSIVPREL